MRSSETPSTASLVEFTMSYAIFVIWSGSNPTFGLNAVGSKFK